MTLLHYDDAFLRHETPAQHPEKPERVRRAWERLEKSGLAASCQRGEFADATEADALVVHSPEVVQRAADVCSGGGGYLDEDTPVVPASLGVAFRAAGAVTAATDAVIAGKATNAFCLVRPPGHHATPDRSMGFCLLNSVAIAAKRALETHQLTRVLVVDWDVHHGNGTQDILYADPRAMFLSSHRYPFYPGTGAADETGTGPGLGFTKNVPVAYGTPAKEFRARFAAALEDAARRIRPEMVLLSAGFDAHRQDPVGDLGLDMEDFDFLAEQVLAVADTYAFGRLVSVLEGGYNIPVLAGCVERHVELLLGRSGP